MQRALKLRQFQITLALKIGAWAALIVLVLGIILSLILLAMNAGDTFPNFFSEFHFDLSFLQFGYGIFIFVVPIIDGLTGFSTALRTGVNRQSFFQVTCLTYLALSLADIIIEFFKNGMNLADFQGLYLLQSLAGSISSFLFLYILSLLFLQYGKKVIFIVFGLAFLVGIGTAIPTMSYVAMTQDATLLAKIATIALKVSPYLPYLFLAILLGVSYQLTQKMPGK